MKRHLFRAFRLDQCCTIRPALTSSIPHPAPIEAIRLLRQLDVGGDRLTTVELLPAYRRARPAFIGCLEQYFVVLKESEPRDETSSGFDQLFGSQPFPSSASAPWSRGSLGRGSRRPQRGHHSRAFRGGPSTRSLVRPDLQGPSHGRKRLASQDGHLTPSKKKDASKSENESEIANEGEITGESGLNEIQTMDQ